MDKNLVFRIIEYGLSRQTFTLKKLEADLNLSQEDGAFTFENLCCWHGEQTTNHILITTVPWAKSNTTDTIKSMECRVLPTAIFQYVDYLEIKAAREAARESKRLAWLAIIISLLIGLFQIILQVFQ